MPQGVVEDMQYDTDDEEFDPEGDIEDKIDDDQSEEEDNSPELSSRFVGKAKRHVPDQMGVFLWSQARKFGSDFTPEEWKTVSQAALIKSYNSHPDACMFAAQSADAEVPDLKFKDKKDLERQVSELAIRFTSCYQIVIQLKLVQSASGSTAAATTKVLVQLQDECEKLSATAKDYRDPSVAISDPRVEMAEILDAIKKKMMAEWAKILSDAVKMNAWQFTQILLLRRFVF